MNTTPNDNLETAFIKTKKVQIFKLNEEDVETQINDAIFQVIMETGKTPKVEFKEKYVALLYNDAEEIQYNPDEEIRRSKRIL